MVLLREIDLPLRGFVANEFLQMFNNSCFDCSCDCSCDALGILGVDAVVLASAFAIDPAVALAQGVAAVGLLAQSGLGLRPTISMWHSV